MMSDGLHVGLLDGEHGVAVCWETVFLSPLSLCWNGLELGWMLSSSIG